MLIINEFIFFVFFLQMLLNPNVQQQSIHHIGYPLNKIPQLNEIIMLISMSKDSRPF